MSDPIWFEGEPEPALTGSEAIAFVGAHWIRQPQMRILDWCKAGRLDAWGYFTAIEHRRGGASDEWSSPYRVIPARFLRSYALDLSFETFDPEIEVTGSLSAGEITISFGDPVERVQRVTDIAFRLADVERLVEEDNREIEVGGKPTAVENAKRGRPRKWDWEGAIAHMAAVLSRDPDGLPAGRGAQAKVERQIADWFRDQTDDFPSEGEIRIRAKLIFDSAAALASKGRKKAA